MNTVNLSNSKKTGDFLKNFLNATLKEMMSVTNAECGSLFLFDSQNNELVLDSFYNSLNLYVKSLRQRVGEGISGKVVDLGKPILVKDINTDARFSRNGFNHYRTNSFISIPLVSAKGLVGLINLADKSSAKSFSENDLEFAITISKYACFAIDSFHKNESIDKQKLLLEKYASVGKLAAGVVHEINNPLDGVIRYTNILLEQVEQHSITREYLLEIKKGLNRIANITKSLLQFSHQINSETLKAKEFVDMHKLIDDSLCILGEKFSGRVQIKRKYHKGLPRILDMGLEHVFINVIKNALDAMPEGGILDIATNMKDSVVEIIFKDSGLGIPDEIKQRIFEPFFTTKSMDKGTGLGLSMCKEIMDRYTGHIEVQSLIGKGSAFTILIPQKYLENA